MKQFNNEHPSNDNNSARNNPLPKKKYDLVIIGSGPAGLTAAKIAAYRGKTVALIERDRLGGECINVGCIPSKAIIRTSRLYADMHNAKNFGGVVPSKMPVDFSEVMARMRRVLSQIRNFMPFELFQRKGIDLFFGQAQFVSPNRIAVDDVHLNFKKAIIATGSRPDIPEIPGLAAAGYLTYENVFNLTSCPESLLVIGGGALGCELAQAFCRLGAKVTLVQCEPMFLDNVERDGAQLLSDALEEDGVAIYLNSKVKKVTVDGKQKIIEIENVDAKITVNVTDILIGIGQIPNTDHLNLDVAKVKITDKGCILVDDYLRTTNRSIYAVGNICEGHRINHIPDAMARTAVHNALFNQREKISDTTLPWCLYTDPEIAHIGLQVREAREQNIPVKTFTILMHQVARAVADSESVGFVKVHVKEGSDKILGATIVARHAGDIMNMISLAIENNIGLSGLAYVDYPYPTQGDAIKLVANAYLISVGPSWRDRLRRIFFKKRVRVGRSHDSK